MPIKKVLRIINSLKYFLIIVLFIPNVGHASTITADNLEQLINQTRIRYGSKPLSINDKLSAAALDKALDMKIGDYFSHTAPDGKTGFDYIRQVGYQYQYAGENLAHGFSTSEGVIDAWVKSPTHFQNMINPEFQESGMAVVIDNNNRPLIVHFLGRPASLWFKFYRSLSELISRAV